MDALHVTEGHLLGGRLRYAQPAGGFRSGIEPVLLAAAIPARSGESVLEAGSGAGAGLLCLATRVAGISGLGVEIAPSLAGVASRNAVANGFAGLRFIMADITAWKTGETFDHAMANPPYHPAEGTQSSTPDRARAKHARPEELTAWIAAMANRLRPRGSLTLILPASRVPDCLAAFTASGCGSPRLLPLWPRAGQAAKLVLCQAFRGGRSPFQLLPGLVLHDRAGFTEAAENILRAGAGLALGD